VQYGQFQSKVASGPCRSTVSLLTVVPGGGARMGPRNLVVQGRQLKECNRLSFFFRAYAERVRTLGIIDPRKSTIPGAWIPASQPE